MKKKIAILGSTGSIGKSLLNIVNKDKKKFQILLLSAKENYKELLKQAKIFNVKNIIITDKKSFLVVKKKNRKKLNIYDNFNCFEKIFRQRLNFPKNIFIAMGHSDPRMFDSKVVLEPHKTLSGMSYA